MTTSTSGRRQLAAEVSLGGQEEGARTSPVDQETEEGWRWREGDGKGTAEEEPEGTQEGSPELGDLAVTLMVSKSPWLETLRLVEAGRNKPWADTALVHCQERHG